MSRLTLQEFFQKRHELLEKIVLDNADQVQTILQDHGLFAKVKQEPDEDVTEILKLASDGADYDFLEITQKLPNGSLTKCLIA